MTVNEENFNTVFDAYINLLENYMRLEERYFKLKKEYDEYRSKVSADKQMMIGGMFI